ncbi:hypothetical protein BSA16_15080 [Micromonospora sp. Rc5]|nr:hypothetical protein [Micromonospora sp. DH15]OON30645.1 hypothetical protein BSA16_15080 [Micromonospora sp. Rc5]
MTLRRLALTFGVVLPMLLAVGACQAPRHDRAALRVDSTGDIHVLVSSCEDEKIVRMKVFATNGGAASWYISRSPAEAEPVQLVDVPLLSQPDGWRLEEHSLKELAPDQPYTLDVSNESAGLVMRLRFDSRQLGRLTADEMLSGRSGRPAAMAQDDFQGRAREQCKS